MGLSAQVKGLEGIFATQTAGLQVSHKKEESRRGEEIFSVVIIELY